MSQPPLYTIGYGARELTEFIDILSANGLDYVVDVRSRPYSRFKPDFSKDPLEKSLAAAQIRYVFMGEELGGQPDDPACYNADGKVDYESCAQRPQFQDGLARLQTAQRKQLRVVLMCSEGKPENCHRAKLIGEALVNAGLEVVHIDEDDRLRSHEQIMLRVVKGQPSLFGNDFFKLSSRKTYQKGNDG